MVWKEQHKLLAVFVFGALTKILLIPAYFSTDFDVHQNWLRITSQLPINEWYYDETSRWTLDYPPFFAYFEYILAKLAIFLNLPQIVESNNRLPSTIYFQRATVIASEIVYFYAHKLIFGMVNKQFIFSYLLLNFIILDNIHFQYNIMMQGLLLLSVYYVKHSQPLKGAFIYSMLLNFKHIYIYASPAFFIYLLKSHVYSKPSLTSKVFALTKLAAITLVPFVLSFFPFILYGGFSQISQIMSRLFPFQRGLVHAYWAPNFWALYHFADKMLYFLLRIFNFIQPQTSTSPSNLKLLPEISALVTICIILVYLMPLLYLSFKKSIAFQNIVFLSGLLFFFFGFHVHEKAIVPYLSLGYIFLPEKRKQIMYVLFVSLTNLMPLMIEPRETVLKLVFMGLYCCYWVNTKKQYTIQMYMVILSGFGIIIYNDIIHPVRNSNTLQFLPLMMNSVWAGLLNLKYIHYQYGYLLAGWKNYNSHDIQ